MAVTGLAVGGLSLGGTATAATSNDLDAYADDFATVVDVVEAGADNTGTDSVVDVIKRYRDDDTLLQFPPGRYYLDEQIRFTGFDGFGLVGDDATLVPANYHDWDKPRNRMFRLGVSYSPGRRLVFDGFDVDYTGPDTGVRVIEAAVSDGLTVRDITINGRHDSGMWGPARLCVTDADGSGVVERFKAPDGAAWISSTPNDDLWRGPTGILANENRGTLRFEDCVLGGFPDNGLYAAGSSGPVLVEGGLYENSNGSSIRIGGTGSSVSGATIRITETPPHFQNQWALRLEDSDDINVFDTDLSVSVPSSGSNALSVQNTCGDVWIQGVDISVDSTEPNSAVVVSPEVGFFTLFRTSIEHNVPGGYAVLLKGGAAEEGANLEYVTITGSAGDSGAASAIRNLRDDTRFSNVTIDQPFGDDRYGLVSLADDCKIYECDFRSNHYPALDAGTGTWVEASYMDSYGGRAAYALHRDSADIYLKQNRLVDGYDDYGCEGLRIAGNDLSG